MRILAIGAAIVALPLVSLFALAAMARSAIDAWGHAYVVDGLARLPPVDTALVLGTAPFGVDGQDQRTLSWRLDTAAGLWHGGIVEHFIVSGIRIGEDYDEASVMRDELVARGVPAKAIELDQHGNRTWTRSRGRDTCSASDASRSCPSATISRGRCSWRAISASRRGVSPARGDNYGGLYGTLIGNAVSLVAYVDLLQGPAARVIAAGPPR